MNATFGLDNMHPIFESRPWELTIPPPWSALVTDGVVELTQPEGFGAVHISGARKRKGPVSQEEILAQIDATAPVGSELEPSVLGEFTGKSVEYVDWHADRFWKRWFVSRQNDLLFITYTCKRGDEEMESAEVLALLKTLRSKPC
jgi:hypothetical protein